MDGRGDEPGENAASPAAPESAAADGGPADPERSTTAGVATATGPSSATPEARSEDDLAAETTHQVDTAGAARGDVRRPGAGDTPRTPSAEPVQHGTNGAGEQRADGAAAPAPSSGPSSSGPSSSGLATIGTAAGPPAMSDLSSAQLLRPAKPVPRTGWRRAVYVASGGTVNPGESEADAARRALVARVNQPLQGCYKIAMLSLKGGVGKTTTTAALGATFASLRGDRVVAVDANPDRGTLAEKVPVETTATVRHLLRDAALVRRYSDVRAYTSQGPSRLEVLASEQDPAVSEAFSELDYRRAVDLLEHFYNIVLTDCGTGLMHSAMRGVLDVADSLVVVSSSSIDGARSASATLDWLDAHGYGDLVARSTAVINYVRRSSGGVDLDRVAEHFAARCRTVARLPFDPHLDEGAEIELEKLAPRTRTAMLELAAVVADDFPRVGSRVRIGPC
ncbi:MAG TPA: MinD/ParA family protein [Actinomycetospora sp.]|jgi:MinD-like ATPase involved in chromosome partitioning or flagellar assembly|uniref:MinD/ParA family ATP-binding protein n=1 Tax=Actinomycetospora sp. TaxID=1872135 RepID=UPI002F3F89AC